MTSLIFPFVFLAVAICVFAATLIVVLRNPLARAKVAKGFGLYKYYFFVLIGASLVYFVLTFFVPYIYILPVLGLVYLADIIWLIVYAKRRNNS